MKKLEILHRTARGICAALYTLGGGLLLLVLGLTLVNIVLRACGAQSLRGVVEISGYLCAAAIGLCLPQTQLKGCHLTTGMLANRLPLSLRRIQSALTAFFCAAFLAIVASELFALAMFVREMDERVDGWNFSYYGLIFAVAAGCALQTLVVVGMGIETICTRVRGKS